MTLSEKTSFGLNLAKLSLNPIMIKAENSPKFPWKSSKTLKICGGDPASPGRGSCQFFRWQGVLADPLHYPCLQLPIEWWSDAIINQSQRCWTGIECFIQCLSIDSNHWNEFLFIALSIVLLFFSSNLFLCSETIITPYIEKTENRFHTF